MLSQKQLTVEQLDKKTTLTDAALVASLNHDEKAGVLEILNMFEPQRRVFKNMLRLLFTIAGFFVVLHLFPTLLHVPEEKLIVFRVNQYQIYLILLTLWGFELKMQEKRLAFLLNLASTLGKKWYRITRQDVLDAGKMHLFDLFTKHARDGKFLHIGFIWLLIVLTLVQFVRQAIVLFGS